MPLKKLDKKIFLVPVDGSAHSGKQKKKKSCEKNFEAVEKDI